MADDLDGEIQVPSQSTYDLELLVIFLAEDPDVRAHGVKKLCDDRCHAAEVTRPLRPAQKRAQLLDRDVSLIAVGVNLLDRGLKQNIDLLICEQPAIARE